MLGGNHTGGVSDELKGYEILSLVFVTLLLFGFGLTLSVDKFYEKTTGDYSPILLGVHVQYLIFPLMALGVGTILQLPSHFKAGLLILGTMPGGALSNFLCLLFQSDFHLSLVMTTISTLLSLGMIPFNIWLYFEVVPSNIAIELRWFGILLSTFCVIFGVTAGMLVGPRISERNRIRGEMAGQLAGLGILVAGSWRNIESKAPLWGLDISIYAAVILFIMMGLLYSLAFTLFLRYEGPVKVTVVFECVVQNASLGIGIITASIRDEELRGQAFAVPILQIIFAFLVCLPFGLIAWKLGWTNIPPRVNPLKAWLLRYFPGCADANADDEEAKLQNAGPVTGNNISL